MKNSTKKIFLPLLKSLPSFVFLGLVLLGIFVVFRYFDSETLATFIEDAGIWAPLALIVAKASTIVIAPLGGAPLYPLAGALFGFWSGFLYLIIGDAVGGTISFYLSRFFGRSIVNYFFPDNKLIDRVLHALGSVKGLLIAQVSFISFPELISYAAGLTKIRFVPFFIIFVVVSSIPRAALVGLGTLLTDTTSPLLYIGGIAAAMVMLGVGSLVFARYMRSQNPDLRATMQGDEKIG